MRYLTLYRAVIIILIGFVVFFLVDGASPLLAEPGTTLRLSDLKGGGWLGYRVGYLGTAMLLAAQVYLLRPGFLSRYDWLNMHCYLTMAGGTLILIHSGFPYAFSYSNPFLHIYPGLGIYGLIGVQGAAAWFVLVLILSGIFGRYLYREVSRNRGLRTAFKWWHIIHAGVSGALYVTGVIHLIIAVSLKYVTAV